MTVITDTDIQSVALASSVTMSANQSCVKTAINASGSAPIYACRAWVNCNGVSESIRGSGNVSSVTDEGSNAYTITFTTAMPNANYCVSFSGNSNASGGGAHSYYLNAPFGVAPTTTAIRVKSNSGLTYIFVAIFA